MSTQSAARILVLAGSEFACVKIAGRANFGSSIDFRSLAEGLVGKGCRYFVLDLSECVLMDSTFLGVLAGFGLKLGGPQPREEDKSIELLNPSPRILDLLENLGVLHLFKVRQGLADLPANTTAEEQPSVGASKEELTRASLEAHKTLMEINPENVTRFKDVARFLQEDLNRMQSQQ